MELIELTAAQARRLAISSQGLHRASPFGRGPSAMLACIERLGYIQIDTISVINRAHHHTFWTRVPGFCQDDLEMLQRERKIFEYWSHAAAYLPMEDFRFCLPYMNAIASGQKHWRTPNKKEMKSVLKRISAEGPLRARDFESANLRESKPSDWGKNKPAKNALEQLFIEGQLMISHREGFQKVYDLTERVLPGRTNSETPSNEEFFRYLIQRTIQSHGFASEPEMIYLRKGLKKELARQVQQMLTDGELVEVRVRENPNRYYSKLSNVERARSLRIPKAVKLLSPFDNLVIQRKRLRDLFAFEYQIECYVPQAKRVHGYFCLPILYGDRLVGRLDPKADRIGKQLIIQNLVIEKEISDVGVFVEQLAKQLCSLARFNICESVSFKRCNQKKTLGLLKRNIRDLGFHAN